MYRVGLGFQKLCNLIIVMVQSPLFLTLTKLAVNQVAPKDSSLQVGTRVQAGTGTDPEGCVLALKCFSPLM